MHRIANVPSGRFSPATAPRTAGLTVTEVIIASSLLVVAMIPILKALTNSYLGTAMVERRTHSLALAQGKLDEISARSVYNYADDFAQTNQAIDGSYLCNITDSGSGTDLRTVSVSVGFDLDQDSSLDADEINVTLSTLIAKRW